MKSVVTIVFFLVTVFAASAWAQGDQAKGKTIVETKKCAICHKEGGMAKPMEQLAAGKTDEYLKGSLSDPKKTIGPQTKMPAVKLSDAELQDVVAYLKSIAKK